MSIMLHQFISLGKEHNTHLWYALSIKLRTSKNDKIEKNIILILDDNKFITML